MKKSVCIATCFFLFSFFVSANNVYTNNPVEIGIEEKLGNYIPNNIEVYNINGDAVNFKSLINKPTILSLVYFRCPGICSPLMNGIADFIQKSDMKPGKDYQVLTVSFDSREKPELANKKRKNYLSQIQKTDAGNGWFFFTGDSINIARLTDAVGFRYKQVGNDFQHGAGLIVLSPDGKITRYLNGIEFLPFEVKMSVVEASKGQPGTTINKLLQFCYSYDPKGQQYALNIQKVGGVLIMFTVTLVFLILILKPLLKKKITINN